MIEVEKKADKIKADAVKKAQKILNNGKERSEQLMAQKNEELSSKRKSGLADVEKRVSKDALAIESKGKIDATSVENISADKKQKAMSAVVKRLLEV